MHHIQSNLCEVFECTEPELTSKAIFDEFRAWLNKHPEIRGCVLAPLCRRYHQQQYRGAVLRVLHQ